MKLEKDNINLHKNTPGLQKKMTQTILLKKKQTI